jgi:hypothetical protein
MLNLAAFIRGTEMPSVSATPPDRDDVFLTAAELSVRWRLEEHSLANLRTKGEGIPFTKLPSGSIRYKLADVLEGERDGQRGFSWEALNEAMKRFPGLSQNMRVELMQHLRKTMK